MNFRPPWNCGFLLLPLSNFLGQLCRLNRKNWSVKIGQIAIQRNLGFQSQRNLGMASEKSPVHKAACKDLIFCFLHRKCWIKIFQLSIHSQVTSNWKKGLYTKMMSACWGVQKAASQQLPAFVDLLYFPPSANLVWPNNFRHEPSTIFIMMILHILRERALSFENVKIIVFFFYMLEIIYNV